MYTNGELIIHHKEGIRKYYDLTKKYIDPSLLNKKDPLPDELEHQKWRILRRINAVGLLWNKSSDAWLNIRGLTAERRNKAFSSLLEEQKIIEIAIEGIKEVLYIDRKDIDLIETVLKNEDYKIRCEFIAPP